MTASAPAVSLAPVTGEEHWTHKGEVRLALWRKYAGSPAGKPPLLFVHGSSMASRPAFDLELEGRPASSVMNVFARLGYDTWCVDMEGYGRSDKHRPINADIATGADDLEAASAYVLAETGADRLLLYGGSSGALRAALFTERHPERVERLALLALVWTGEGSPTLEQRRKKLPEYLARTRRPIDRAFLRTIFERDHPGTADDRVIEAFADAVLAYDDSVPTGTYVDMCTNLPLVDPARIPVPTLVLRGQWDGIASFEDVVAFFARLPNPDKHLAVVPGVAHASLHERNGAIVHHLLHAFFDRPTPVHRG
ncbi:MAG TPA: alpha/beta hydrolase [Thermodesulfobacteriota bacterium]